MLNLRQKIKEDLPFKYQREIVKTLVKEIVVESHHGNDGRACGATIHIKYAFSEGVSQTLREETGGIMMMLGSIGQGFYLKGID